jgi:hypothetical protein
MVLEGCHLIHIHAIEKVALGHECYQMLFLTIVAGAVPLEDGSIKTLFIMQKRIDVH